MGLLREDGSPKPAARQFVNYTHELGICQWFHYEDPRLSIGVEWLHKLNVRRLRTGLSWADHVRPGGDAWADRQMRALEPFEVTVTFCFTPESHGIRPHHMSPPVSPDAFADFCARMVRAYAC